MGLMSSWPALAITNHFLIRMAALNKGYRNFSDYLVLGDDVVIFNTKVSDEYVNILETLGVDTKPEDSIMPGELHSIEIAKRLFRLGREISPLPMRLYRRNKSLFYYHSIDRGILNTLDLANPGCLISKDIRSLIPSLLLYV